MQTEDCNYQEHNNNPVFGSNSIAINIHDYHSLSEGTAVLYGTYNMRNNNEVVRERSNGDRNTPSFPVVTPGTNKIHLADDDA